MGQTELVRKIQLRGITMTRETLVKIERGVQHIYATQLKDVYKRQAGYPRHCAGPCPAGRRTYGPGPGSGHLHGV